MSKLTFLFCVALTASAIQTASGHEWVLRALQEYIDGSLNTLQETADKFQKDAEAAIASTNGKAAQVETQLKERTDDLIQQLSNILDEGLVHEVNVDDCRQYVTKAHIEHSGELLLGRTKECINKYLDGNDQIRTMALKAKNVVVELNNIKLEAEDCINNVSGLFPTMKVVACITSAKLKAKWEVTKRIPNIIRDQILLATKLDGLPEKVTNCLPRNNLERFEKPIQEKLERTKSCVSVLVAKFGKIIEKRIDDNNC